MGQTQPLWKPTRLAASLLRFQSPDLQEPLQRESQYHVVRAVMRDGPEPGTTEWRALAVDECGQPHGGLAHLGMRVLKQARV